MQHMQHMQDRLSSCGKHMVDSRQTAQSCPEACQHQVNKHRYVVPSSPANHLTPPPSEPGSPRRSSEMTAPDSSPHSESRRRCVAPALNRAFSSEEEDELDNGLEDDDSTTSSLFPNSVYRTRADSRRISTASRPAASPVRTLGSTSRNLTPPNEGQDFRTQSRSMTPERRLLAAAPMSAAFARLSHKDASERMARGRALAGSNLGAKMFEGAA